MSSLTLHSQEIPFDTPDSCCMFYPSPAEPFVATPAAIRCYGFDAIICCLHCLRRLAQEKQGIDHLQIFSTPDRRDELWLIEDGDGGAITALLPYEY